MSGQEKDRKPADNSSHITLKVQNQDGNEVIFRIKRSTQLKKLMHAYCDRHALDFNSIRFLLDGRRVQAWQTPNELEMEDDDQIDAMQDMDGGSTALDSKDGDEI